MKYNLITFLLILLITSCSSPKARKPVSRTTSTFIEKSIARNKSINAKEEAFFKKIIAKDTLNKYHNYKGFWYYYNTKIKDSLTLPKKSDEVVINYEIKTVAHKIIYNKEELGTKGQEIGDRLYKVDGEEFITGIQEGIKLMKKGETITFLFPSNKVFGASGFQDKISPNQPLIITVFLKDIKISK